MGNEALKSKMKETYWKILNNTILDSEIIQDIKSAKNNYFRFGFGFRFDINWVYDHSYSTDNKWTFLIHAVNNRREELVEYILSFSDINVNYKDGFGRTALYFCDQVPILKLLLSRRNLDVNTQSNGGRTVLYNLCYYENDMCVKELLLDARVDIMIHNNRYRFGCRAAGIRRKKAHRIANMLMKIIYTPLLRIPNWVLCRDIIRMIIEEYA